MTKDDFIFNLKRCGCFLYKDGNTYYEENELIKCFEDVGAFNQPSVKLKKKQKPKTGHWIKRPPYGFKCSKCLIVHSRTSIFCPSCGAKMIE